MARTSYSGYLRQYGSNKGATPVPLLGQLIISFDPTQTPALGTGKFLPGGSRVLWSQSLGGATGGASPTVDLGTQTTPDAFADELAADAVTGPIATAAGIGSVIAKDTEVYARVGDSAATGGTCTVILAYVMDDDGSF